MSRAGGIVGIVVVPLLVILSASPAAAITGGAPDGDEHPYVGMVFDGNFVCSGSAISPTLFVTAAHCFDTPGTPVVVTFDPDGFAFDSAFYFGHWYPDPAFCFACGPGLNNADTHDVAVVVLDTPLSLSRYAQLPSIGLADTVGMEERLTIVGFGVQNWVFGGGKPQPGAFFTRFTATAALTNGNAGITAQFLKLSANKGGTCFGDSGGPVLRGDTVLGVNSFGRNELCKGNTYSFRIDTDSALAFIGQFV